jgi:hypothetical protein
MTVTARWFDDKKELVLYTFEGKWTWDELYPVYREAIAMEKSVSQRVDVVLDMLKSTSVPANALMHVKNFSDKQPENLGLTVVVTSSGFVHALYDAGIKFYKGIAHYFRVVSTMDDAFRMISEDRQSHHDQPIGKTPGIKTGPLKRTTTTSAAVVQTPANEADKRQP